MHTDHFTLGDKSKHSTIIIVNRGRKKPLVQPQVVVDKQADSQEKAQEKELIIPTIGTPQVSTGKNLGSFAPLYSGTYEGSDGVLKLELRIDVNEATRHSSPLNMVSGGIEKIQGALPSTDYNPNRLLGSWMAEVKAMSLYTSDINTEGVEIIAEEEPYDSRSGNEVKAQIRLSEGKATVKLQKGDNIVTLVCTKVSDTFRPKITLEVDVCASVNIAPLLPTYDPAALTDNASTDGRVLGIEGAFREAGLELTVNSQNRSIIDDSLNPTWTEAELHNFMVQSFSQVQGSWPSWNMWGLLAGRYENEDEDKAKRTYGLMFDTITPSRQGFAIFRQHAFFDKLTQGTNTEQQEAMRHYLFSWIHEMGHCFGIRHSFELRDRADSLSWMNYDWKYNEFARSNEGVQKGLLKNFWKAFNFKFADYELQDLRHLDKAYLMMGGDALHAEVAAPFAGMGATTDNQQLALLVRSKAAFEFLEPVFVEVRLKNLATKGIEIDRRISPDSQLINYFIEKPDKIIVNYHPITCLLSSENKRLLSSSTDTLGKDRFSEQVYLGYGKGGFYFDKPGNYRIWAECRFRGEIIRSKPHNIQIARSKAHESLAADLFTDEAGLNIYFGGTASPALQKGLDVIRTVAENLSGSATGMELSNIAAKAVASPFHGVQGKPQKACLNNYNLKEGLSLTEPSVVYYKNLSAADYRSSNMSYAALVKQRATYHTNADEPSLAKNAIDDLCLDLAKRGVKKRALDELLGWQSKLQKR